MTYAVKIEKNGTNIMTIEIATQQSISEIVGVASEKAISETTTGFRENP